MRTKSIIFAVLVFMLVCFQLSAQEMIVWNNPVYKNDPRLHGPWGNLISVKKVTMTSETTAVTFHIDVQRKMDIDFAPTTCLKVDDAVYPVIKWDGAKNDGRYVVHVPEKGEADFTFCFKPLPFNTKKFNFTENDNSGGLLLCNISKEFVYNRELFPSSWRDSKTGEWLIGFRKDGAIYDSQVWSYQSKKEKKKYWDIVLTNGKRQVQVKVGKPSENQCRLKIDNEKPIDCDLLFGKTLPDYPLNDNTPFANNNYRQGDSVTIRGWLVNMSEQMRKNKEFSLEYTNILTGEENKVYTHLDSLGRFTLTFPILNTQEVFIDWDRTYVQTVVEPGETYFLFCDFNNDQKLFMGRNSRFQNELLAYPMMDINPMSSHGKRIDNFDAFVQKGTDFLNYQNSVLDSLVRRHPSLSGKYLTYQRGYWKMDFAENLGQARFNAEDGILPLKIFNQLRDKFWAHLQHPYTLYAQEFNIFARDFTKDMLNRSGLSLMDRYLDILKQGCIKITPDKRIRVQHYFDAKDKLKSATKGISREKEQLLTDVFNTEYVGEIAFIDSLFKKDENKRLVDSLLVLQDIEREKGLCDSLDVNPILRNILLSRFFYSVIDTRRHSFNPQILKDIKENITMPQARELLLEENNKYLAIENQPLDHAKSLKSSDVVNSMTDGEKILRKILEPYKNKIVLVDVWGSWCGPCKKALSHSKEEYKALAPYDVVFLYLADNSPKESCENIIKEYGVTGQNVIHYNLPAGQQQTVENFLGVTHYPTYKLIDRKGQVLSVNADPRNLSGLVELIKEIK
jgi:thiol-disulfide isomerase/thioredoxin